MKYEDYERLNKNALTELEQDISDEEFEAIKARRRKKSYENHLIVDEHGNALTLHQQIMEGSEILIELGIEV